MIDVPALPRVTYSHITDIIAYLLALLVVRDSGSHYMYRRMTKISWGFYLVCALPDFRR